MHTAGLATEEVDGDRDRDLPYRNRNGQFYRPKFDSFDKKRGAGSIKPTEKRRDD
jgi:hypothetical protein